MKKSSIFVCNTKTQRRRKALLATPNEVDIYGKRSGCPRLRLNSETYLVRKSVCSKFSQRKLEAAILAVVDCNLDSNRGVRRRDWVSTRHDGRCT